MKIPAKAYLWVFSSFFCDVYMHCDINFEGRGLKFVEDLAQPFLNGFA